MKFSLAITILSIGAAVASPILDAPVSDLTIRDFDKAELEGRSSCGLSCACNRGSCYCQQCTFWRPPQCVFVGPLRDC